jgi:hypothetical protein
MYVFGIAASCPEITNDRASPLFCIQALRSDRQDFAKGGHQHVRWACWIDLFAGVMYFAAHRRGCGVPDILSCNQQARQTRTGMADIFISYAREDADIVRRLAAALQEAGYSSWWDANLTSGSRYLKETEAELKAAKAVLVVWSKASVESHWVADEAAVGRDENRLVAVTFDVSMPPLGFRQFQVTDFRAGKAE